MIIEVLILIIEIWLNFKLKLIFIIKQKEIALQNVSYKKVME